MKTLVVGLGISGLAASKLLLSKGESVWITEKSGARSHFSPPSGAIVEFGGHSEDFVKGKDLMVVSPGVHPKSEVIRWAKKYKIPVISELELASQYAAFPLVCVTGTNGKSTVTSLIDYILRYSGKRSIACGNLGTPLSEVVLRNEKLDIAVVEVSSFQLEYIRSFRPYVGLWLNFSSDHLDHHTSIDEYLKMKKRIFENQTKEDWAVINNEEIDRVKKIRAKRLFFDNNNLEAAIKTAGIFGIGEDIIRKAVKGFKPLPHRMQHVAAIDGIDFIDDSKATNVHAVIYALNNLTRPVILILGGRDKADDFTRLRGIIKEKVISVVVLGEAREKIISQLDGVAPIHEVSSLEEAVDCAFNNAASGTTVLLSPGCSSFDMFRDYSERGERFQEVVRGICPAPSKNSAF